MASSKIEAMERELFAKPLWFGRPNIRFAFNAKAYHNGTFGTRVGPTDSLIEAGMHELAHCIDFELTGKPARLQYEALEFRRPYANAICVFGRMYDDFPQSSRGSWAEIRTNAIQALLMMKAFGTCYRYSYGDHVDGAGVDNLIACSVEEALRKTAVALWVLDDACNFKNEAGSKDNNVLLSDLYFDAMLKQYHQINTPFGTQRIKSALNRVNARLGKLHAQHESFNAAKG